MHAYFKRTVQATRLQNRVDRSQERHWTGFEDRRTIIFAVCRLEIRLPPPVRFGIVEGSVKAAATSNHVRYVNAFLLGDVCTVYHRYVHGLTKTIRTGFDAPPVMLANPIDGVPFIARLFHRDDRNVAAQRERKTRRVESHRASLILQSSDGDK